MEHSTRDGILNRIRVAAADKESLQFDLDRADALLQDAVRAGLAAGVPAPDLAAASGLPLQEVEDMERTGP